MSEFVAGQRDPEDEKLVVLARSARARNGSAAGAAVRDTTGRTYVATTVELASLRLSAVQGAVAMAVSGGAEALETGVVVTDADLAEQDVAAARDLGAAQVLLVAPDGSTTAVVRPAE